MSNYEFRRKNMTNPSVIAPVGMALETVRRVLFQPFNLSSGWQSVSRPGLPCWKAE